MIPTRSPGPIPFERRIPATRALPSSSSPYVSSVSSSFTAVRSACVAAVSGSTPARVRLIGSSLLGGCLPSGPPVLFLRRGPVAVVPAVLLARLQVLLQDLAGRV